MSANVRELTAEDFDKAVSSGLALVDLWAPWCGPCKMQGPVIEKVAAKYSGKATIAKLNVDEYQDMAMKLGVTGIPTLILFKDGREIVRLTGLRSEAELSNLLDSHIG